MDQQQIIRGYRESNQQVLDALKKLDGSLSQLTRSDVTQYALKKANVNSVKGLLQKLKSEGIDTNQIPRRVLIELVALDDWGTILKTAWPLIQQYGLPILQKLYTKHVQPKLSKFLGGDEGINPIDWGHVLSGRNEQFVPGLNMESSAIKSAEIYDCAADAVDTRSIVSLLCPEVYQHRYSFLQAQKTALAHTVTEYSVITNSSGSVGMAIYPLSIGSTNAFVTQYNAADFTVNTGTQTTAYKTQAGPLSGLNNNIEAQRVISCSVRVVPVASYNTAGMFTLGYKNRQGIGLFSTSIGVNLSDIKIWPYVQSFNNKTEVRMIMLYGDPSDEDFKTASNVSTTHKFVLLGSGLPGGVEVARVLVDVVTEFIPTTITAAIAPLDFPRPGPMTEQLESLMFARFPVLQSLSMKDAYEVTRGIPFGTVRFHDFIALFEKLLSGITKPLNTISHMSSDLALPLNMSLDMVME
jgi:hypothetical protein